MQRDLILFNVLLLLVICVVSGQMPDMSSNPMQAMMDGVNSMKGMAEMAGIPIPDPSTMLGGSSTEASGGKKKRLVRRQGSQRTVIAKNVGK